MLSFFAAPQHAQAQEAEDLFKEAELNFGMARFQRSLRLLKRAQRRTKDDRLVAQILLYKGLNYAVLSKHSRAKKAFRAALQKDPTLVLKPGSFKPSVIKLFQTIRTTMKGFLVIKADQDNAEVILDDTPRGMAPSTLDIPIGTHQLKIITADGRWVHQREVLIRENEVTKVDAELESVVVEPPPPPSQPAVTPPPPESDQSSVARSASHNRGIKIAGWALAGVGGASLIAGAVLGGLVSAKSDEHLEAVNQGRPYEDLQAIAASGEDLELGHTITLIAGGGLLATGVGLLIWSMLSGDADEPTKVEPQQEQPQGQDEQEVDDFGEEESLTFTPMVHPGGAGLVGTLRF